jgi:hypothetical protein
VGPASKNRTLVVCDFDWSLVEENSDTWVLAKLGATDVFQRLKATGELRNFALTSGCIEEI